MAKGNYLKISTRPAVFKKVKDFADRNSGATPGELEKAWAILNKDELPVRANTWAKVKEVKNLDEYIAKFRTPKAEKPVAKPKQQSMPVGDYVTRGEFEAFKNSIVESGMGFLKFRKK